MTPTERRERLRSILHGDACVHPATVFDPLSAHLADEAGYALGVIPGSVAAAVVLGVPDLVLLTLTEFAEQVRRTARYSRLSIIADADHGYGNALHAMRAVEEMEAAGAAALTLEDTLLPAAYGTAKEEMVPAAEMSGKLRAAVRARSDASLVIVARTNALRSPSLANAVERLKAYEQTGVDAVMLVGVKEMREVEAAARAVRLPMVLGGTPSGGALEDRQALAQHGVRIAFQGHLPFLAALRAMQETMQHLAGGGSPAALKERVASEELLGQTVRRAEYARLQQEHLGAAAAKRA
ncbi:MAG: oxaloacetate decarboxylase [Dehalococcoidia bacterium]|nr:oxaloacetate decarboxylase [Dehalococcoidia bacterium]